jgi:hypothetical protein
MLLQYKRRQQQFLLVARVVDEELGVLQQQHLKYDAAMSLPLLLFMPAGGCTGSCWRLDG